MFDLDKEVAAWSARLARRCGRDADIAELEDHLRSTFEHLSAEGVPPERAFELAVSRMGDVAEIEAEYEKNRSTLSRFHDRLARWDRASFTRRGAGRETSVAVIFASLIIAVSLMLSSANISGSAAAGYLLITIAPLWLATRMLSTRR